MNTNQLELAIYLRYGHLVNYPEIWEYIILFLNKYIEEWYSKYLSWIRLIPRKIDIFPRTWFFKKNKIKKYNVKWEEFNTVFKNFSIPFHLSHSTYTDSEELPHIVSWWMKSNENSINLWLELENSHDKNNTNKKTINEILKQVVETMQKLDEKLDKEIEDYNSDFFKK
jgi:hypothetical protein